MNAPLKHKLFSLYGQLLNIRKLRQAWKHVESNGGCAGIDKVDIEKFKANEEEYIEQIYEELKGKTYKPSPVKRTYIPKKNGKMRPLGIPTIKDRIIQQALVNVIQPFFEEEVFHVNSCGFRPNRGAKLVLEKIIHRLDREYNYIYDFDIKGFFDHVNHKKLMKILNKYISDGTVLDLIWKWLKAGYMEDNIRNVSSEGLPQGGVISPILANIFLNELDWELANAGFQFIRYADDGIVMCKSKEELERAKVLVKKILDELGLELAEDKTKDIDFHDDDFDFLGFTFKHLRMREKEGEIYLIMPSEKSIKSFKSQMKELIKKGHTFSFEKWREILNPIIRGKFNYFLTAKKARNEMIEAYNKREPNRKTKCRTVRYIYAEIDAYIRNRLRINLANRGKKTARYIDGRMFTVKYNNAFFLKDFGLVSGEYLLYKLAYPFASMDLFLERKRAKKKRKGFDPRKTTFFQYALSK